ncbi:MAG: hemin uptake protein HemP [Phycisphaerae bacterium]|jgi:hemin uptake protein HemP|nr:hemin uptake protein HemP [Phycisphaerae bacterium]
MKPDIHKHIAPPHRRQQKIIDAEQLLGNLREVRLRFGTEEYRLSITRNQKLILTK